VGTGACCGDSRWCFLWPFLHPLSQLMLPLWLESLREITISPILGLGHKVVLVETQRTQGLAVGTKQPLVLPVAFSASTFFADAAALA